MLHVKELLSDCAVMLATQPTVKSPNQTSENNPPKYQKWTPASSEKISNSSILPVSECFKILEESKEIPLQAGAIRSLTEHLKKRRLTKGQLKRATAAFELSLKSDDSFLFLSGIQGLAYVPNYDPELLISKLGEIGKSNDPILQMKIAEVLVRVVEKKSVHSEKIMNQLLNIINVISMKDVEKCPDVMASSLVCIAKLFSSLGKANLKNNYEVFKIFFNCSSPNLNPMQELIKK